MPTVDVWNLEHEKVGTIELAEEVFGHRPRERLVWEVVKSQMAKMRRGTASTRTRATVSGTGGKPFRQKRTGRARQGTRRAPHHVGGGAAFAASPLPLTFGARPSSGGSGRGYCRYLTAKPAATVRLPGLPVRRRRAGRWGRPARQTPLPLSCPATALYAPTAACRAIAGVWKPSGRCSASRPG